MYDISKEYIERLLKESGVKLGGAKACAITTLVELLDANSLDGLLASIRADYDAMKTATKNLERLKQQEEYYQSRISSACRQLTQLETKVEQAQKRIKVLKEEEQTAQFEADLRGCREEERSRLIAYEAAIRIGKAAYGDRGMRWLFFFCFCIIIEVFHVGNIWFSCDLFAIPCRCCWTAGPLFLCSK